MKQLFLKLGLVFFIFSLTFSLQAQTNVLDCEKGPVEYTETLEPELCYSKSEYPNLYQATNQFTEDMLAFVSCNNTCRPSTLFDCHAIFVRFTVGGSTTETDSLWCFGGTVKFEWKCSKCIRKTRKDGEPTEDDETGETGEGGLIDHDHEGHFKYNFSPLENSSDVQQLGHVKRIYPNPSSGYFFTNILVEQDHSEVNLSITDLSGKSILQKTYGDIPRSVFNTKNDLGNLPNGIYILSVKINNQLVGTSKLTIANQ